MISFSCSNDFIEISKVAGMLHQTCIYTHTGLLGVMAKMLSCPCGWTLISPQGDDDVKKHTMIHVTDTHPGMTMSQDELTKMIKAV